MNDLQRDAMATLAEIWALSPDVRLGQLFAHLGFLSEAHFGRGLGDIDDDDMIAILERHKSELIARLEDSPNLVPEMASSSPHHDRAPK